MLKKIKFGTDGWRGIIGQDFNLKNVEAVAQAIADYLLRVTSHKLPSYAKASEGRRVTKVVVGYDTRRLSQASARRIASVLAANKIKVILSRQVLPVQAISYAVRAYNCSAGIMVTASHNPADFNGIKIKGSFGGPLESEITDKIEKLIFQRKALKIPLARARKKGFLKIADLISAYLKFLESYLDLPLLKQGCLKVLVDPMYGAANSYIARLLKDTPHDVTTIHTKRDPLFGGNKPEPIASCLKEASSLIRRRRFDIGLVTDGDADRIAALDGQGRFISPQQIIGLLALHLIRHRKLKGALVKTIAGTAFIDAIAKKYRLKVYETPVGFKHISYLIQRKNILIGGEEAGGIGFKNYLPERDGILAGLLLLEMLIAQNKSFADLLKSAQQEFGSFVYLRKDLKCSPLKKPKVRAALTRMRKRKVFSGVRIKKVKDYDGLKFCLADGSWILFRLSGTEPALRIYAESSSLARTKKLIADGQKIYS